MKRLPTNYPGVFYREGRRIGGKGVEKIFYVLFKKNGRVVEEKAGRQYADDMTPARAATIRAELIEGKRLSRKEVRQLERAEKQAESSKWTIDKLWEAYKQHNPGLKGWRTYESQYRLWIKPSFGEKEPKHIIQLDVDRLRIKILKKRSPQTAKHVLALLRRLVNFGVTKQLCRGVSFVVQMPTVHNMKTEDLNAEQLKRLLKAIEKDSHPQAGAMMKMALFTGMRRGELFKLQWRDVDFERGFIHIRDPKGGPDEKIPMNLAARDLLRSRPRTSEYVFPGRNGGRRTDISKQTRQIAKDAGLPPDFRPLHGLRHTYASMIASSGQVDMYTLQKLLTHKDPKMTQRYAHLRDEAMKKAAGVASSLIQDLASERGADVHEENLNAPSIGITDI